MGNSNTPPDIQTALGQKFKWANWEHFASVVERECYYINSAGVPELITDPVPTACDVALKEQQAYLNKFGHEINVIELKNAQKKKKKKKNKKAHQEFYDQYVDSYESGGSIVYPEELGHVSHENKYEYLQQDHTELAFTGLPLFAIVILCLFGVTIICCLAMAIGGILGYAVSNKPRRRYPKYKRISHNGNRLDHSESV